MSNRKKNRVINSFKTYWGNTLFELTRISLTAFFFIFICNDAFSQTNVDAFTTTGRWVCPAGVTSVTVECWGGGGAGGGASGNPAAGGGGAGGAYALKVLTVVPGTSYTVTVGGTKTATATSTAAANTGNPSWFGTVGTVYAQGGPGGSPAGTNSTNGAAGIGSSASSIGDLVYAGGNGSVGNYTLGTPGGAGGGGAGSSGDGGDASGGTLGTGTSANGGNGANGVANSTAGAAGSNYGGAGSGGKANSTTDRAGGRGAAGYVTITYNGFCASYCTNASPASYFNAFSTTGGITDITNSASGASSYGYGDFTAQSCSQAQSSSINFSTTLVGTTVGVNIWVDWNQDGDFDDTGEKVYASGAYVSTCSGSFTVPATATVGNTRMRIRLDYNSTNPAICGSITRGETEDYTFIVTSPCSGPPSSCANTPTPSDEATGINPSQTLSWSTVSDASSYDVYFGTSDPPSYYTNVSSTSYSPPLNTSTTYYWYVVPKNLCGAASGCNNTVWSFTTADYCSGYSYRTRATGNWNDYANVWQVSYDGGAWADVTTSNTVSPYYPQSSNSCSVEICNSHYITANVVISSSNTTVDYGGTLLIPAGNYSLTYSTGSTLTNNGTLTISAGGSQSYPTYPSPVWDTYGLIIDGGNLINNYIEGDTNQLWINPTGVITLSKTTGGSSLTNYGYINNNGGYYQWTCSDCCNAPGGNTNVFYDGIYYYGSNHASNYYTATITNYGTMNNYSITDCAAGYYRGGIVSAYDLFNYGTFGNFFIRASTNIYHNLVNYNGATINNGSNFTTYCTFTNHGTYYENWSTNINNSTTSPNSSFTNASDGVFNIMENGALVIENGAAGTSSCTNDGIINNYCQYSSPPSPNSLWYGICVIPSSGTASFTNGSTGIINNYGQTINCGTFTNNGIFYNDDSVLGFAHFKDTVTSSKYGTMTNNNIFYDNGPICLGSNASNSFTNTDGSQFIYQTVSSSFTGTNNLKYSGTGMLVYNGTMAQTTSTKEWPTAANVPTYIEIDNSSGAANGVTLNGPRTINNLLTLTNGALKLNANTLTINNPSTTAINVTNGYVVSEHDAATNNSKILWKCGTTTGSFVFPFGANDGSYIPLTFNKTTAGSSDITISTRATAASDNQLLATGVSNMNCLTGGDGSVPSVIDRWWDITPTAAVTADVTFSYRGTENTTAEPLTELAVQHWNSSGSYWNDGKGGVAGTYAATGVNGVTSGVSSVTATGLSEFSPYILVLRNNFLPVEVLNFSAACNDQKVKLNWTTASETNNDYFTIERSVNSFDWEPILKVSGSGTTNEYKNYYAVDNNPFLNAPSYYRLQQVDYDGQSDYSAVVTTDCSISENQIEMNFSDNDGELNIFITNAKSDFTLKVFNMNGKLVCEKPVQNNDQPTQQVLLSKDLFSPGFYVAYMHSGSQDVMKKFIVR